ncbi:MAG: penicillin-binding protein 2 [Candidatus Paceibacterota bacterium]
MAVIGSTGRIRALLFLVILVGIGLVGKLYLVQIVNGAQYSEEADHQYVRPNHNLYNRGTIYFQPHDGEPLPAATLDSGFTVAINPQQVSRPEETYRLLSSIIDIEKESFLEKAAKEDDPYEEIAKRLDRVTADALDELPLEGVQLYKEKWRHYPGDSMAAHTLGIVGYQDGKNVGQYGLERFYEEVLRRGNSQLHVNFFAEVFSNMKDTIFQGSAKQGSIVTGIEPNVQALLESQLEKISNTWNSRLTGGIIMDPATGQILAMAVDPTYDPNDRSGTDQSMFKNPLIENVHEMGSIIKPITMAIGLDAGAITPDTTYNDKGFLELSGYTIKNYDGVGRGIVSMQDVLNESLNTGSAFVAQQVDVERFANKMRAFGLGEKTKIDLPSETSGLISNLETARDIEVATASYGQGIAMSPISTTRALAVLANGGRLVTPHVGRKIVYDIGGSTSLVPDVGEQVIDPTTSETITRMLVNVVDEALAGGEHARDRHSIAAKTGTAQIPIVGGSGYYENKYLHSFFGYAPAYDPKFLVFLYTIEPQGTQYASQTLTDPFMDLITYLINYYEVPPDR